MKDKTARIIAIIALVFMAVFVVSFTLALANVLDGVFTYVAIGSGAVGLALFLVIKLTGRGYSITEINNEIEMEKIQKALEEQVAKENAEKVEKDSEQDLQEENKVISNSEE